jgi:hypothetical protein
VIVIVKKNDVKKGNELLSLLGLDIGLGNRG